MTTKLPDAPSPRGGRTLLFVLGGIAALIILLVGGGAAWLFIWRQTTWAALQKEQEQIRAAGEPLTHEESERAYAAKRGDKELARKWTGTIPPQSNNAPFHRELNQFIKRDYPAADEPWPDLAEARAWLERHREKIGALHSLAESSGNAQYPVPRGFDADMNWVIDVRAIAGLLSHDAHVKARDGDSTGAARSLAALFALGRSLDDHPCLIASLVRVAIIGVGCLTTADLLPQAGFTEEDLALIRNSMDGIEFQSSLRSALEGERVFGNQVMEQEISAGFEDRRFYLETMRKFLATTDLPWPEGIAEAKRLENELATMLEESPPWLIVQYVGTALLLPALAAAVTASARGEGFVEVTRTAIAVEQFRLRTGSLPAALDDLVPGDLPQVPLDPFDGRPLRYLADADGFAVYSIGPNGQDDGGSEVAGGPMEGGDIVVEVRSPPAGE